MINFKAIAVIFALLVSVLRYTLASFVTLKPFSDHDGADTAGGISTDTAGGISSEDYHTGQ